MEQNTNSQPGNALIVSESAKENFNDFLKKIEQAFPTKGFDTENVKLIARDKCAEVYIPLKKQAMIEDIVDAFAIRMYVNILYAARRNNGKEIRVIGYSMPYSQEMYIVSLETLQYGITEGVTVAFYDSLEEMLEEVRYHYLAGQYLLTEPGVEILEAESYSTMLSHFF